MVKPRHPFQRRQFQQLPGLPGCPTVNQFSLVEAVYRFCQGVVIAVALAAHRRLNTGLGKPLAVANGHVLRPAIGVVYQRDRKREPTKHKRCSDLTRYSVVS